MVQPCLCGDPYCPSCGDPSLEQYDEALYRLFDMIENLTLNEEEFTFLESIITTGIDSFRKGVKAALDIERDNNGQYVEDLKDEIDRLKKG